MINITPSTVDNLVIATGHGKVTSEDYEATLIPAVQNILRTHSKVRLLYQLAEDCTGFTPGAMWEDTKLGLGHLSAFEAVAVVTDHAWITEAVKLFGFCMRCPVKVFHNHEYAEAAQWAATTPAWRALAEV